jgi:hypothetical protein
LSTAAALAVAATVVATVFLTVGPNQAATPDSIGTARVVNVVPVGKNSCLGAEVQVTVNVSRPASSSRELWLIATLRTGNPSHAVYYAKRQLGNYRGQQIFVIKFIGAAKGSSRKLVVASGEEGSYRWLEQNLAHDGDPGWDINRLMLKPGVRIISQPYQVTRAC